MLTAYNDQVQNYMTQSAQKNSTSKKEALIQTLKEKLKNEGRSYGALFSPTKSIVLDMIFYLTSGTGIWKIGSDALANKCDVSTSTVFKTVAALKTTDTFVVARLADQKAGKYIFVNKLHQNFKEIMRDIFHLEVHEINDLETANKYKTELRKEQETSLQNIESTDTTDVDDDNLVSNNFNYFSFIQEKSIYSDLIKEALKKEAANQSEIKSIEKQEKLLEEYGACSLQMTLFDLIVTSPYPELLKKNAYKIVLRSGSNLNIARFNKAKKVIHELALSIHEQQKSPRQIVALFDYMYKKALSHSVTYENEEVIPSTQRKVMPLYNWLENIE